MHTQEEEVPGIGYKVTSHAVAFWTDCRQHINPSATAYSSELQYSNRLTEIHELLSWKRLLRATVSQDEIARRLTAGCQS